MVHVQTAGRSIARLRGNAPSRGLSRLEPALWCSPVIHGRAFCVADGQKYSLNESTGNAAVPYWQLFYHIVWTTKNRGPLLTPTIEPLVHEFLRSKAIGLGATVFTLNGTADHVHHPCLRAYWRASLSRAI